jgi:acetylglutamate/LysW-gamma-L-alpha-aminoadipate kinase
MLIVVKVGGSVIRRGAERVLVEVPRLLDSGHRLVLIHGGGYFVSEIMGRMGLEPRFVKSPSGVVSRYTDRETLNVYVMAMMLINKEITGRLMGLNVKALGLSGVDGGLLRARRRENIVIIDERGRERLIDGGYTGKIEEVNSTLIKAMMDGGYVPVIAPIAIDARAGVPLNVDSDQVLEAVCSALGADYAIILTDVEGLVIGGNVVRRMSPNEALELFKNPEVTGGMKRKLYMAGQLALRGTHVVISTGLVENPVASALGGSGSHVVPLSGGKGLNNVPEA